MLVDGYLFGSNGFLFYLGSASKRLASFGSLFGCFRIPVGVYLNLMGSYLGSARIMFDCIRLLVGSYGFLFGCLLAFFGILVGCYVDPM